MKISLCRVLHSYTDEIVSTKIIHLFPVRGTIGEGYPMAGMGLCFYRQIHSRS